MSNRVDQWKTEYLALSNQIEEFQKCQLNMGENFEPPLDDPFQGNVGRLLHHYLNCCREMLWAEVNGGLDEEYQEEIDHVYPRKD